MNAIKLSAGCVALAISQVVAAAGPYVHHPITTPKTPLPQVHTPLVRAQTCCSAATMNGSLSSTIKISPHFVTTYEPSTNLYIRTPRLRIASENRTPEINLLLKVLKERGSVTVPTTLADPEWMNQYRGHVILTEDPKALGGLQLQTK